MRKAHLTVIGIASGLAAIIGGAEWVVTYCVFSDYCPLLVNAGSNLAVSTLFGAG
jgi:hypothetical protein